MDSLVDMLKAVHVRYLPAISKYIGLSDCVWGYGADANQIAAMHAALYIHIKHNDSTPIFRAATCTIQRHSSMLLYIV